MVKRWRGEGAAAGAGLLVPGPVRCSRPWDDGRHDPDHWPGGGAPGTLGAVLVSAAGGAAYSRVSGRADRFGDSGRRSEVLRSEVHGGRVLDYGGRFGSGSGGVGHPLHRAGGYNRTNPPLTSPAPISTPTSAQALSQQGVPAARFVALRAPMGAVRKLSSCPTAMHFSPPFVRRPTKIRRGLAFSDYLEEHDEYERAAFIARSSATRAHLRNRSPFIAGGDNPTSLPVHGSASSFRK